MAYRQIHLEIWNDPWFLELEPDGKLLFVYLFSNGRTNMIGLYELSIKQMAFETGLSEDAIEGLLSNFEQANKIRRADSWIWVKNLLVRNITNFGSPKVQRGIVNMITDIPNSCSLKISWVQHFNDIIAPQYDIATISIPYTYHSISEQNRSETDTEQKQTQKQQQKASVVVDDTLLLGWGWTPTQIGEAKAVYGPEHVWAWCVYAQNQKKLKNPGGFVASRLGQDPPENKNKDPTWQEFMAGDYAEYLELSEEAPP